MHGWRENRIVCALQVLGALCAAFGALASGLPEWLARDPGVARLAALRGMFIVYGLLGRIVFWLYRRLPARGELYEQAAVAPLGPSRGIVMRLAALFSVDAFAGGLVVNSLLSLWLFQRFGLSLSQAGVYFFAMARRGVDPVLWTVHVHNKRINSWVRRSSGIRRSFAGKWSSCIGLGVVSRSWRRSLVARAGRFDTGSSRRIEIVAKGMAV
jgi:hypothetical protein